MLTGLPILAIFIDMFIFTVAPLYEFHYVAYLALPGAIQSLLSIMLQSLDRRHLFKQILTDVQCQYNSFNQQYDFYCVKV